MRGIFFELNGRPREVDVLEVLSPPGSTIASRDLLAMATSACNGALEFARDFDHTAFMHAGATSHP